VIQRSDNGGAFFPLVAVGPRSSTGNVTYIDIVVIPGNSYTYRVAAGNDAGLSAYSNTATINM